MVCAVPLTWLFQATHQKVEVDKKRSRAGSVKPTGPTRSAGCVELVEDSRS